MVGATGSESTPLTSEPSHVSDEIEVKVHKLSGASFDFWVQPDSRFGGLKAKIAKAEGVHQRCLVFLHGMDICNKPSGFPMKFFKQDPVVFQMIISWDWALRALLGPVVDAEEALIHLVDGADTTLECLARNLAASVVGAEYDPDTILKRWMWIRQLAAQRDDGTILELRHIQWMDLVCCLLTLEDHSLVLHNAALNMFQEAWKGHPGETLRVLNELCQSQDFARDFSVSKAAEQIAKKFALFSITEHVSMKGNSKPGEVAQHVQRLWEVFPWHCIARLEDEMKQGTRERWWAAFELLLMFVDNCGSAKPRTQAYKIIRDVGCNHRDSRVQESSVAFIIERGTEEDRDEMIAASQLRGPSAAATSHQTAPSPLQKQTSRRLRVDAAPLRRCSGMLAAGGDTQSRQYAKLLAAGRRLPRLCDP